MRTHRLRLSAFTLVIALAGCAPTTPSGSETTASVEPSVASVTSASPSAPAEGFPIETFAGLFVQRGLHLSSGAVDLEEESLEDVPISVWQARAGHDTGDGVPLRGVHRDGRLAVEA